MTDARDDIRDVAVALRKHPAMLSVCLAAATSSKDLGEALDIFEDAIEAALRAQYARGMEEAAKVEWQPIETAPRDGTRILAWMPPLAGSSPGFQCVTWFLPHDIGWCIVGAEMDEPTYWKPLPTPPAIRAKQKETGA